MGTGRSMFINLFRRKSGQVVKGTESANTSSLGIATRLPTPYQSDILKNCILWDTPSYANPGFADKAMEYLKPNNFDLILFFPATHTFLERDTEFLQNINVPFIPIFNQIHQIMYNQFEEHDIGNEEVDEIAESAFDKLHNFKENQCTGNEQEVLAYYRIRKNAHQELLRQCAPGYKEEVFLIDTRHVRRHQHSYDWNALREKIITTIEILKTNKEKKLKK